MRYVELTENTALVPLTPTFLQKVRAMANRIASDIAQDLPTGQAFADKVAQLLQTIDVINGIDPVMTVWRAEMRDSATLDGLASVGSHWCWHSDSPAVYHHDNAYDDMARQGKQRSALVEFVMAAEVALRDIDWVFTVATNLILPGEREITIRSGTRIKITTIYVGDEEIDTDQTVAVYGSYKD